MRDIEINPKILTKLKESAEDDNEYQFFVEVIKNCADSVGLSIPREIERELSICLQNRFTIPDENGGHDNE